jgi:hypothetical protein
LAGTLNRGLDIAKGIYIARQDQDDVSHPQRLKMQVEYLEKNKNINLLGTRAKVVSESGSVLSYHNHAIEPCILKFDLLFDNCFVHSSVMFRKQAIDAVGKYSTDKAIYEDFELWSRFSNYGKVANLKDVLVDYRHHDRGLSKVSDYFNVDAVLDQSLANISKFIGKKEQRFEDLAAVYHFKQNRYKGTPFPQLKTALTDLGDKVASEFPGIKEMIDRRCNSYLEVIRYKLNVINRKRFEGNLMKQLMLRIEMKLHRTQTHIKND